MKKTQLPKEVSDNECDDFFNNEEFNEFIESETESEDKISNIDVVMLKTWKYLNPPTSEDDIIGGWYAGIFNNKKHTTRYIGKAQR